MSEGAVLLSEGGLGRREGGRAGGDRGLEVWLPGTLRVWVEVRWGWEKAGLALLAQGLILQEAVRIQLWKPWAGEHDPRMGWLGGGSG